MQRALLLTLLLYSAGVCGLTGSDACRDCHAQEYALWRGSDHDLAMQLPAPDTVLGDFDDSTFTYHGVTTRFYREGDKYMVTTDGEDGELHNFEVQYVFGHYPLQQYLLPLSGGRLQALSVAWDSRTAAEGGQRWYHLYPQEVVDYTDPLHWTGPYQNWNTRCAECHSTDVHKNYNAESRSFNTHFEEVNVGCEACHGPGEEHLVLVAAGNVDTAPNGGFPVTQAQSGLWAFPEGGHIARRSEALASNAQIDSCARCHARRGTLGDYHYGANLLDTHRLSMPQWPLYYHDGQIRDEVYVHGSFIQSKMHQAGVVCSNCHEPHSLALRAPDNGVCTQCHLPSRYDSADHHHHDKSSTGAVCANCHMPETVYMGVDPRRDHSMRVPRPDLSLVLGTPNACNQCHQDKTPQWALHALREWGVQFRDTGRHPARAFALADQGDNRVAPQLANIAADTNVAPVWRANAMEALGRIGGRVALQTAAQLLYDDDPLLRASTVRALEFLPPHQRLQLLQALFNDDIKTVRMEIAAALAEVPLNQLPSAQAAALEALFEEYVRTLELDADMPGVQLQLGIYYLNRDDAESAQQSYREALRINPQFIPAYLNLADLLRAQGKDVDAHQVLQAALAIDSGNGPVLHALGLLETRRGKPARALDYFKQAAELESASTRHRFVYAIALHDLGKPTQAIAQLEQLLRITPRNEDVLLALSNYHAELGQSEQARIYARSLLELSPGNRAYQTLNQNLTRGNTAPPYLARPPE
ncbi:MAG: HEAT repeat domain-containing protein [Halioglobus sp.]|nr:HEAT repeat domain-containing protein [Halioglobus sp.]